MNPAQAITRVLAIAIFVIANSPCAFAVDIEVPKTQGVDAAPSQIITQVGIDPQLGAMLPLDTQFVDASGANVKLRDCLNDKPVVLHLVYYQCPMLCKLSSDGLLSTLKTLSLKQGQDFSIVTLSFDAHEGPELSKNARTMAIERCGREAVETGWRFLTGDEQNIKAVTNAVGFRFAWDERTKQFAHASGIFILTPEGRLSRYLGGIEYSPRDFRLAVVEASDGKVGTLRDQVKLLCYMYDPSGGKYGFAIMSLMRIAGLTTVVGLASAIIVMVRRERRRTAGEGLATTENAATI